MSSVLQQSDWLVQPFNQPASIKEDQGRLVLSNGLIARSFVTAPNFATVDYINLVTGSTLLRGIKPEALITIDGQQVEIAGLIGQPDYAYLDLDWLVDLKSNPEAFQFVRYSVSQIEALYPWLVKRYAPPAEYPPKGIRLSVDYVAPSAFEGMEISIHYDLYQGIPVLSKQISINNWSERALCIEGLVCELIAVNEQEKHRLHVESDYAFSQMETTRWIPDEDYKTQIDYHYQMPLLMTSTYPLGPGVVLQPGDNFQSFRTFELLNDSDDRERKGLARRKMYRIVAPQVTENPIFMHVRQSDPEAVRLAID